MALNGHPTVATLSQLDKINSEENFIVNARVHTIRKPDDKTVDIILRKEENFVRASVSLDVVDRTVWERAKQLTRESLVRVLASISKNPEPQVNGHSPTELSIQVLDLSIVSEAKADLPVAIVSYGESGEHPDPSIIGNSSINQRLDGRIQDARVAATAAIFKIFSGAHQLSVEHLANEDFHWTPTPTLVGYKVPGDDDYFEVPYFDGRQAWLTQTGEVHLQLALAADLERVYDIHSVFRREPNVSTRHLTEFTLIEVGFALTRGYAEILERTENLILFVLRSLQERENYRKYLEQVSRLYPAASAFKLGLDSKGHLLQITFQQAKQILRERSDLVIDDEADFSREEEGALGRHLASGDSSVGPPTDIFIITRYPRHIRPYSFYPAEDDSQYTSNSFDVIIGGQECASGLQLLHSYKEMRAAMAARKPPINPDAPEWRAFTAAYEAAMPPQGGFGLGLNRLVQGFLGLTDVHETVLFPRDASRLAP